MSKFITMVMAMVMMVMTMMVMMMVMMAMIMVMIMVMLGAPELCSRIPPHFVRRSRSFDFGRSRSYCKDQGSACPKTDVRMILPHLISFILFFYFFSIFISDLRMILPHLIFSVIVEISPCL